MLKEPSTEKLISQLFDNQPDAVVWFYPVFDEEQPDTLIDLKALYCNHTAARILHVNRTDIIGECLLTTSLLDEASKWQIFQQCLEVWNTGEPIEYTYHSHRLDRTFNVQRSKIEGGILSISRDRTKELQTKQQLQKQEKRYQKIIDRLKDGVLLLDPLRNEKGTIYDFQVVYCNTYAIEIGQLPQDYEGKTLLQLLPHLQNSEQFKLHKQVAENGEPVRFETTFKTPDKREYGWFIVTLSGVDNMVLSRFTNITERKEFEETITEQAAKLDRIINASLNAIFTCEAVRDNTGAITDLRYTQINEMFKQIIGKSEEDVLGRTMLELFPTAKPSGAFDIHCRVIESGKPERFQLYYKGEGLDFWFDISSVRLDDNNVMVTFADITKQHNTFLEIEQQKILLDNLLQYSPSGIAVMEAIRNQEEELIDFRNILLNDRAAEFTGFSKEVLLAKTYVEVDPNFAGSQIMEMLVSTLQTGEACYTDHYLAPTGKWIKGALSKMDDNRLICITTDVTPAKEAQLQMKSLVEELKRSNESLEEFAYVASHDLQEPLRKIHFFSERLKKGITSGNYQDSISLLKRMETATVRMKALIEDLLAYSQVSRKPDACKWVDLNNAIEVVLQDFEPVITETGAAITLDRLPKVNGDGRQLRQLFQNLIGNALKYRKQDVVPQVAVRCRMVQGADPILSFFPRAPKTAYYLIEVSDNGIGFEQQYADKIFNVFTRLHGNNEYAGTGVGLAIVQKVVMNHNGYIAAESTPDEGSTFRVLLPVSAK